MIAVTIPGPPVPAARPRVVNGHAFTPEPYATWKRMAALLIRASTRGQTLPAGPLWLTVDVYHPRPKGRPDYIPADVWKQGRVTPAVTRSDLDNHVKAISDALQDSGLIDNDNRIAHLVASAWFAAPGMVGVQFAIGPHGEER